MQQTTNTPARVNQHSGQSHSTQLRVFVDPDLLQYDEVWAAAGTWNDNFGAAPADIVRVAGGVVVDLKRA
jgi:prolyl-tRNA editing enzyme YbaK/EbsC (Cys-tRNA(Pro) deacylase)